MGCPSVNPIGRPAFGEGRATRNQEMLRQATAFPSQEPGPQLWRNRMRVVGLPALVLVLSLSVIAPALAQHDIMVVKEGAGKTQIDTSGLRVAAGKHGAAFMQTLNSDLTRSGWFSVVPGGSAVTVRGIMNMTAGGAAVRCEVNHAGTGKTYLRSDLPAQSDVRRLAHTLADEIVYAVKKVPGIASTRIAMIGVQGAGKDVYICDADGGNLVRVTSQGAVCLSPAWWPDAGALAYTSFHGGFPDVYRIDLATNRRRKIAGYPGLNAGADISPDGLSLALALSKDGNPEVYIMDLGSRRLTRITSSAHSAEASPSWSPDGKQIVFVSDRTGHPQSYITGRRGGPSQRISFRGSENVSPDWGPDGRIAYSSRREGRYQICIYDPKTGQTDQLTVDGADYEDPSWAADGRHIVCARTVGYRSDLYVLDTMGDTPIRLTSMQGNWYSPAWSAR